MSSPRRALEPFCPSHAHPFRAVVRAWLRDGGDDPSRFEEETEERVHWHLRVDPGISVVVTLYQDHTERVFFLMEAAVARSAAGERGPAAEALLLLNRGIFEAFRVGMIDDGSIVCLARGRAEGITAEYFRRLLDDLIGFAREVQTDLKEKFGLLPFLAEKDDVVA